jgi:hypothetical protein
MQVFGRVGSIVASAAMERERETIRDRRITNRCDSQTLENTHMSKVGGRKRKKVQHLIDKQTLHNKTVLYYVHMPSITSIPIGFYNGRK